MMRATAKVGHVLRRAVHEHDLTFPQFGVLRVVGEAEPNGIKLSDIGEKLFVSCGNVTGLVDRLEEMGLVVRTPHPDDRRALLAKLTPQGRRVFDEIVPPHRARVERLLSCLSEQEQETLNELMSRVAAQADIVAEEIGAAASE